MRCWTPVYSLPVEQRSKLSLPERCWYPRGCGGDTLAVCGLRLPTIAHRPWRAPWGRGEEQEITEGVFRRKRHPMFVILIIHMAHCETPSKKIPKKQKTKQTDKQKTPKKQNNQKNTPNQNSVTHIVAEVAEPEQQPVLSHCSGEKVDRTCPRSWVREVHG